MEVSEVSPPRSVDADVDLVRHVHPPDWTNPEPADRYDLVVLGGGTAGLVSAMGAAGLGARVATYRRQSLTPRVRRWLERYFTIMRRTSR